MSLLSRYDTYLYEQCRAGAVIGTQMLPWAIATVLLIFVVSATPFALGSPQHLLLSGFGIAPLFIGNVLVMRARWRAYLTSIDEDGPIGGAND